MNKPKKWSRILVLFIVFLSIMPLNDHLSAATYSLSQLEEPLGPLDKFKNDLSLVGVTYEKAHENVSIVINEQQIISALPSLESQGVVSKSDLDIFNIAPISISTVIVGIASTMRILNSVFERDQSLEKVNVHAYLIPVGQVTKNPCYSFEYDRKDFMMLDLSLLTPRKFIKITPGFTFDEWCKQNIDKEAADLKNMNK